MGTPRPTPRTARPATAPPATLSAPWMTSPLRPDNRNPRGGQHSLLSAVLEGSIDAIMTFAPLHDEHGRVIDFEWTRVNPVAVAMTGLSECELIGSRLLDHWTSDEMHRLVGRYAKVLATGEAFAIEVAIPGQDGAPRWFHINCLRFHDDTVEAGDRGACIVVVCRDITVHRDQADVLADIRQEHQVWRRQALHDPLTGLANRLLLDTRLEHALRRLSRQTTTIAVMFIDVDGLKDVNDRYGHAVGDHLLIELATRLVDNARRSDTVARRGGDEFVVVCEDVQPTEIPRIAHRMVDACATPFDLTARFPDVPLLSVSVSVGVAIADGDSDAALLIDAADDAMYRAKQAGGNRIAFSDQGPGASLDDWHDVEASLAPAINRGELHLVFDPIVRGSDLRLVAANARVRWDHPARGRLEHTVVTSTAADTHLLAVLHRWVLTEAIAELGRRQLDPTAERITLVVDVADDLLCSGGFSTWLEDRLAEHGVPPELLCIGIADESLGHPDTPVSAAVLVLAQLGVGVERVGVGRTTAPARYSHAQPITSARIAREIVDGLAEGSDVLLRAIVDIAHERGRTLVAEGVDDAEQFETLSRLGVDLFQGAYVAAALPADLLP